MYVLGINTHTGEKGENALPISGFFEDLRNYAWADIGIDERVRRKGILELRITAVRV